ncbi:MAG: EAL domain-containing protein [Candidatus Omnitrophica bacterium]|nr:EAL domain-containing protein [Candidatus Omnitrophota bacterium]
MKENPKKHILIIEDEPAFIEVVKFVLENAGFNVISALNGEEGLEKARLLPDLILLDIMMPGIDGYQVCGLLKEKEETKHIPVIMLTARNETMEKVEAFELGIVDYIGKDFPFLEILARIRSSLRQAALISGRPLEKQKSKKITQIKEILSQEKIDIIYQPVVSLSDKKTIGYEALMRGPAGTSFEDPFTLRRWASEAGKVLELNEIYYKSALKKTDFLKEEDYLFLKADPDIMPKKYFRTLEFLKETGLNPSRICLELPEQVSVQKTTNIPDALEQIRSAGAKLLINDIGEGYSSLKALGKLEPYFIKIGEYLSHQVDADTEKQILIQTIINQAKDEIPGGIIVNGITTEQEFKTLISLGANYGQGSFLQ